MNTRVARLEGFAGETRERLARVEVKLDHMKATLDHIATDVGQFKWWALGSVVAIVLAVMGTGFSIQQMTVQSFQAAAQQSQPQGSQQPIIIQVPAAASPAAADSGAATGR